ncbi:MAG: GGDEF domain-containing protein [Acidimicrobiia bacterium]|nr:GGDEF domain-containing protein [Acidimicrobiia bacterium]
MASSALLFSAALLAVLDYAARDAADRGPSILYLALAMVFAGVYAFFTDWARLPSLLRLLPAVLVLAAMVASIYWADSSGTPHAVIGFTAAAVLVLSYVGFVLPPGSALLFSPLVVGVVLAANRVDAFRVGLAVPLIGVPVAAVIGEVISALVDRSVRTARWFSSRSERLARLDDVLRRFRRPSSLQEAATEVALAAQEIFQAQRATVVLRDVVGGLIPVTIGPSSDDEPDAETAQLVADAIGGDEPRLVPSGRQSMLVLPLPAADVPAGAVVVHPVPQEDPAFTVDLARLFGTQVGIAIEHLFVINQLQRASTRDELTGIGNRKHADALINSLEEGDALILLDLDGFKEVNDTQGHTAGDQVLQDLSNHLRRCLRDSDTSARLGGDEFLVVARRAFADPVKVAQRILKGWDDHGRSTTLSAGVALHEASVDVSETFDRADQALYAAKAAGKNRAQMWLNPSPQR